MKKSYCIFSARFLPSYGGVERYTLNLSKQLMQKGIDVTVVTSSVNGLPQRETVEGIDIFRLPSIDLLSGRFPVLKPCGETRRLIAQLKQKSFDFAIIQTRFYALSLFGARYLKKRKIPFVLIEHGTAHLTIQSSFWNRLGHAYEHAEAALVRRYCSDFYGVSEACCEWLEHFHIRAKGVLYNAIDLEDVLSRASHPIEDYRAEYAGEGGEVLAYVGRLIREKGILQLIDAVKRLTEMGYRLTLLIAGDGDLLDAVRQEESKCIVALGKQDFDHVIALYKASDCFVLPSDSEGFPTTVLEAVACGCYVITTERGGAKELIVDDSYGMVIQDNQTERLMEAIRTAIDDPERRRDAASRAYQRLSEHFTWLHTCEKVMDVEREMTAGR